MTTTTNHRASDLRRHPEPRPELINVEPSIHGSINYGELQRLGLHPANILDFSANVNPYGPSAAAQAVLEQVRLESYPDRECLELISALAKFLDVDPQRLLPGNGASELIWLTALAFVRPGDRVLILGPTYCEYSRASGILGARVDSLQSRRETNFACNPEEIDHELELSRPRLVFICNPNNPTGAVLLPETIASWARRYPGTLFVVDEAYLPFAVGVHSVAAIPEANILALRSMTKDFGLAGLRLGYAVADPQVIAALRRVQPPWSVNSLAQAAGVAALRDSLHRQTSLRQLAQATEELVHGLTLLGLFPSVSATHFFLVPVGNGAEFRSRLLRRGVLVRDCASFGLPEFVRIAARRPEENERLLAAIQEVR